MTWRWAVILAVGCKIIGLRLNLMKWNWQRSLTLLEVWVASFINTYTNQWILRIGPPLRSPLRKFDVPTTVDKNEGREASLPVLLHETKAIHLMTEMGYDPLMKRWRAVWRKKTIGTHVNPWTKRVLHHDGEVRKKNWVRGKSRHTFYISVSIRGCMLSELHLDCRVETHFLKWSEITPEEINS